MSRSRDIANLLGVGSVILDGAPSALDTLNELAAAIGDDANYASTVTTALNNRVLKTGGDTITVESGTTVPLTIQNNGTGNSFVVNDVASDTSPFVIDASGNVGIGQPSPQNSLDVSGIISSRNTSEWNIRSVSTGTTSTNRNHFIAQRANGSSAVTSGFNLGGLTMAGFDGTNYSFGWNGGAEITAYATETWTSTARGTSVAISTTANGSNFSTERLRIDSSGNVGIGVSPTTRLDVDGRIKVRAEGAGEGGHIEFSNPDNSSTGLHIDVANAEVGRIFQTRNNSILQIGQLVGTGGRIEFYTAASERMRIESTGTVMFGTTVPINGNTFLSASHAAIDLNNIWSSSLSASYGQVHYVATSTRASTAGYAFFQGYSSGLGDMEFNLRGDGNAFADGTWTGGGADYAEYFEWLDGNPNDEDRRGIVVTLEGDKIKPAQEGDIIIGAISGNPSVIGDAAWNKWHEKYLRDDYGTYIFEDYEVLQWVDEEGKERAVDADGQDASDAPEDATVVIQQRRKLNPAYDPDVEYISRENRPEWDCVGLMGKLRIRRGQPVKDSWIKMKDISDTVEEWLVF